MAIKPGYLLKITTWENDADNYNTKEIAGLKKSEAVFLIKVCELFKSCNSKDKGYGNADVWYSGYINHPTYPSRTDEGMVEDIMSLSDKHRVENGGEIPKDWNWREYKANGHKIEDVCRDYYSDLLYDIGLGTWGEGEYRRVFESYKIFYVPGEIEDVTEEFKGLIDATIL